MIKKLFALMILIYSNSSFAVLWCDGMTLADENLNFLSLASFNLNYIELDNCEWQVNLGLDDDVSSSAFPYGSNFICLSRSYTANQYLASTPNDLSTLNFLYGCNQANSDTDTIIDLDDRCPFTHGVVDTLNPDFNGCPVTDSDFDGVPDSSDLCPNTGLEMVDLNGCSPSQLADDDGDGVLNYLDLCPSSAMGAIVDIDGCSTQIDEDNDGVLDTNDNCPNTPELTEVDALGCPLNDLDNDGVLNEDDYCLDTRGIALVDEKGCEIQTGFRHDRELSPQPLNDNTADGVSGNQYTYELYSGTYINDYTNCLTDHGYSVQFGTSIDNQNIMNLCSSVMQKALHDNDLQNDRIMAQNDQYLEFIADNSQRLRDEKSQGTLEDINANLSNLSINPDNINIDLTSTNTKLDQIKLAIENGGTADVNMDETNLILNDINDNFNSIDNLDDGKNSTQQDALITDIETGLNSLPLKQKIDALSFSYSGVCESPSIYIAYFDETFSFDAFCDIGEIISPILSTLMTLIWSFVGLRIVLDA